MFGRKRKGEIAMDVVNSRSTITREDVRRSEEERRIKRDADMQLVGIDTALSALDEEWRKAVEELDQISNAGMASAYQNGYVDAIGMMRIKLRRMSSTPEKAVAKSNKIKPSKETQDE